MKHLQDITGIGPKTLQKLQKLDINTPHHLLYHFPRRYIDFRHLIPISQVKENQNVTIRGQLTFIKNIYTKTHKNLQIATLKDSGGQINLIWFNQPYLLHTLKKGTVNSFAGTISSYRNQLTLITPIFGQHHTGKIIAIYPAAAGLSSNWFAKTIRQNLPHLNQNTADPIPSSIRKKHQLIHLKKAISRIHSPSTPLRLKTARTRLKLNEILSLQAHSHLQKQQWRQLSPRFVLRQDTVNRQKINQLIASLPFQLTPSQVKVWQQIKTDLLSSTTPTNRLLQGDVGCGKTIVSLLACYLTHLNHHLSLFLAPTEILAEQHRQTFTQIFKGLSVPVKLLTGSSKTNLNKIPPNSIIISTHAAIYQKKTIEKKIGLLIIDEQHKFGVKQRSFLSTGLTPPHTITMTATPIPRTISLTMMGNLDLSVITHKPQNRPSVKTFLVPQIKEKNCYQWISQQITKHRQQAFIVCPFIHPSEALSSVKSATQEFEFLKKTVFPHLKLALIHGQTKNQNKKTIVKQFQQNKINILVTTPIIEVGIDIPNATIIVIRSADRFGLASLHQLRGRVGRGDQQSFCYFFTKSSEEKTIHRLKFLQNHHDGLTISKYDLKTRGPGEVFSTLQHGFPSLKLTTLSDTKIIEMGQSVLKDIIKNHPNFNLDTLIKPTSDIISP